MLKVSIDNGLGKAARGLDADKHPCLKTYRSLLELFHKKIRPEKFFFALRTGWLDPRLELFWLHPLRQIHESLSFV